MKFLTSCTVSLLFIGQIVYALPKWRSAEGYRPGDTNHDTKTWHDDVLGDLTIDDSWYWPNRPINLLPASRDTINTKFILHTRENPGETGDTYLIADEESIDASTFNASRPTKFIIHGFIDTGATNWLMDMASAFIAYGDYNVIRVDWGDGSLPMYYWATANTRVVGLEIGYLVNFLIDNYGVDPADVHLLGHSLGSHISGYAGEKIAGLGRITGMDPAGPYFTGTPNYIRLDPDDALYVDAIHTDAKTIYMLGYGTTEPMGNVDFYPNAGYNQPGCDPVTIAIELITDIGEGVRDLAACSHQRSVKLVTDSLKETCPLMAHECLDYDTFESGLCASCGEDNSKCAEMGIHADEYLFKDRVNAMFYFDTDSAYPYCYYHYQVVINTANPKEADAQTTGHLDIWFYGDNGETLEKYRLTKKHEHFHHGTPSYFLMKSHIDLSRVIRMEVKYTHDAIVLTDGESDAILLPDEQSESPSPNWLNNNLYIHSFKVSPMDYYPETVRKDHIRYLCQVGKDYIEMKSGKTYTVTNDESCKFDL